jgi:hypothetical protein
VRRRFIVLLAVTVLFTALPPGAAAQGGAPVVTSENVVVVPLGVSGLAPTKSVPVRVPEFSLLGADIPDGAQVHVRVRLDGAPWGSWTLLQRLGDDDGGPDAGTAENGDGRWRTFSEPLWTGRASEVQVRGTGRGEVRLHLIDAIGRAPGLGSRMLSTLGSGLETPPAHAASRLRIVSRRAWGANESWRRGRPTYTGSVRAGTLHHTAGSNTYSRAEAAAVVRGIYHYHTRTLGWSDIGYHFLVDRFGTVYEGRAGGMLRPVLGAHAGGFNTDTFGISIMGSFDEQEPSLAAQRAVAETRAWKMAHHGIKPRGSVTLTSAGSTRYERGRRVRLPTFFAHRDVSATACPGAKAYALMRKLRGQVADPIPAAQSARPARPAPRGPFPLFGDWDGDGVKTPGWWRAGRVSIRLTNTSGPADHQFRYGRSGDVPVVGDWNGDGRDSLGVVRGRTWLLRHRLSSGRADRVFRYGRAGDWPVAGDWNADGRDGIGVVRGRRWLLRQLPSPGAAMYSFRYGRIKDWPVVGDWNGDGRTTPGFVRGSRWYQRATVARGSSRVTRFGPTQARPLVGHALPFGGSNLVRVKGSTWLIRHHEGLLTQTMQFGK